MSLLYSLLDLFNSDEVQISETTAKLFVSLKTKSIEIDWTAAINIINTYPSNDSLILTIDMDTDDHASLCYEDGVVNDISLFESQLEELMLLKDEDDCFTMRLEIQKNLLGGPISVYATDVFIAWIKDLKFKTLISLFSELYESKGIVNFVSYDKDICMATNTFKFIKGDININQEKIDRKDLLESRGEIISFQGMDLRVVPDDFNVLLFSYIDDHLLTMFNQLKMLLSLIYISNMSNIYENSITIHLNGYRNTSHDIIYDKKSGEYNDYIFKIYKWTYGTGNKIDKIVLARNMISLHCRYHSILELGEETFNAIVTNYSYYLKQNTYDYLEKKKELHISLIEKCSDIADAIQGFSNGLKNNFLAYFTYVATLIISNTFVEGKFEDIFTNEMTLLTSIIILGSFIYFIVSLMELNSKYKSVEDYIEDLSIGYGYMFDKNEIATMIESNNVYKSSKRKYITNRRLISGIWIMLTIILFIALDYLSGDHRLLFFLNFFK